MKSSSGQLANWLNAASRVGNLLADTPSFFIVFFGPLK
ncbi:hypothetical protein ACVWV0_003853 [Ewingella americana]